MANHVTIVLFLCGVPGIAAAIDLPYAADFETGRGRMSQLLLFAVGEFVRIEPSGDEVLAGMNARISACREGHSTALDPKSGLNERPQGASDGLQSGLGLDAMEGATVVGELKQERLSLAGSSRGHGVAITQAANLW